MRAAAGLLLLSLACAGLARRMQTKAAFNPSGLGGQSPAGSQPTSVKMVTDGGSKAFQDLEALAKEQNPVIGYFDPLSLARLNFWNTGEEATIGFLRHAEIKHGRVAMAAFIGYIVHENGIRWPWALSTSLPDYSKFEGLSAPAVWDAIPWQSKLQIILAVGFLEAWSETKFVLENDGEKHYMRGGKPGYFPTFDLSKRKYDTLEKNEGGFTAPAVGWGIPHPVPFDLYDPFGLLRGTALKSEEQKARLRNVEVNNGRLAMIGIMGFLAEAKLPGSVPALAGLVKPYAGDVMAPFAPEFSFLSSR